MIRIREATMLALTKLRTRKVRLIVTIIISGLLFGVLAGASMGARGAFASISDFNREGLSNRYLAQGYALDGGMVTMNKDVIARATAIYKDTVEKKKAEAKKLGIEYSAESDHPPVNEYPGPNGTKFQTLDPAHPASRQALQEYYATHPITSLADFKKAAGAYHATAYYESRMVPYDLNGASIQVLKDGKEAFDEAAEPKTNGPPTGLDTFTGNWTLTSDGLLQPFILPGENLQTGKDGSIPMIIPVSAAEQLLGVKALPNSAPATDRLARTRETRQAIKDFTFSVCYRNAASLASVHKAVAAQQDIEANKDKKDYQKPDLQYGLPATACAAAPVIRDVRTTDQKTLDTKQAQFDKLFGARDPEQTSVRFRVVGLVPDADYEVSVSLAQIAKSLVTSTLGNGWYAPLSAATQNATVSGLFAGGSTPALGGSNAYFAEFADASQARAFIDKQNCTPDYSKYSPTDGTDPAQSCITAGKRFALNAYGSNSLGLENTKHSFQKIFTWVSLGIAAIACIIMMGTVGKMIADSRRETAVFRAIGAKKLDIAHIYVIYTILLSVLVFAFAVLAGLAVALYANHRWAAEMTQQALVAYNAQDLNKTFKLYSFYLPDMLYLLGMAIAAGLLSATLPLIRNLRRNPIRDMRDDT